TAVPAVPAFQMLVIGDALGGEDADVVQYLADNQLDSSTTIILKSSGLLDLNGFNETLIGPFILDGGDIVTGTGLMTMNGNITVTGSITNTSTIDGHVSLGAGSRTFNVTNGTPVIELQINAEVSGGSIIKGASGLMNLAGSNTFTGTITINDGVMRLEDD